MINTASPGQSEYNLHTAELCGSNHRFPDDSGQGNLDAMTVSMIREAGLFNPVPENLAELASGACSLDGQDS